MYPVFAAVALWIEWRAAFNLGCLGPDVGVDSDDSLYLDSSKFRWVFKGLRTSFLMPSRGMYSSLEQVIADLLLKVLTREEARK
jgi:hypothetical protein